MPPRKISRTWKTFFRRCLIAIVGATLGIYALIVIVDPYDTLFLSPPLERAPVVQNQRFAFPALARKARFDSAIFGTSTARLIKPKVLNRLTGGRFANLAMNSATSYEQFRLLQVFARHHPKAKYVVIGLDQTVWCQAEGSVAKLTPRPFPEWMYDENRWNDFRYVYSAYTLEKVTHQLAYLLGFKPSRAGLDGYGNFLPPASQYDAKRALRRIYGKRGKRVRAPVVPPISVPEATQLGWPFKALPYLENMIKTLPASTKKLLMFVPIHAYAQPAEGSLGALKLAECKRRVAKMARAVANAMVYDFMIRSTITTNDRNYWDRLHYGVATAALIERLIATALVKGKAESPVFRILAGAGAN